MAKTIKFNLICDGKSVRTLEDLRNNFSIEDILEYYNNKLLHRWLTVRGYEEELKKVQAITETENIKLVKALISAFQIETDLTIVEENTYILQYKQEREFLLEEYKKMNYNTQSVLEDYHAGYRQLIDTILENKNDIAKIKAAIKEIDEHYGDLYEMNYRDVFYTFYDNAPMAIFVMLMNNNMRKKHLPITCKDAEGNEMTDIEKDTSNCDKDKSAMYSKICSLNSLISSSSPSAFSGFLKVSVGTAGKDAQSADLSEMLGVNLKEFAGVTDGYWKDVETKEKKYLILKMDSGNFVRSAGVSGGDLNFANVDNQFVILDGIDYKSNNADHKLLYMEV